MSGNVPVTGFRLGFEGVTLENRLAALADQSFSTTLHVHVGGTSNSTGLFCGRLPIYIAPSGSTIEEVRTRATPAGDALEAESAIQESQHEALIQSRW